MASVFLDEAKDLLDNLEEQILTLESNPEDKESIGAIFRAIHTIKGSASMFGFKAVSEFAHEVESTLSLVRDEKISVDKELIGLSLKARDHIRDLLNAGQEIHQNLEVNSQTLTIAFKTYVSEKGILDSVIGSPKNTPQNPPPEQPKSIEESTHTFRVNFSPCKKIFQNGTRPELLLKELCGLGKATVVSFYDELDRLSKVDSELCYFSWDIILTTQKTESDIREVFIFLDNESSFAIEEVELAPEEPHKIGEIFVDRSDVSKQQLDSIIQQNKPLGQILVEKQIISPQQVKSALAEQEHFKGLANDTGTFSSSLQQQSIRVNPEKLDYLVDLIGELVTFNARLEQLAIEKNIPALKNLSEQCERLVISLRDTSLDIRMLPIGTLFNKFRRTVRDISDQLGKKVDFIIEGADTELDKTVIEKLNDPLLHLVRNALDHGVEFPAERIAYGKNPLGMVKLSAKHQGAFVTITVSDDGKGLNKSVIQQKGIEKKLISKDDKLSEIEIFNLIFQPGFSTAKNVSNISGRGVGMDVVKKDIMSLGGSVSIESEFGKGTNFVLKIPLTLAIIDGMLTQVGNTKYIIPVNTISECLIMKKIVSKKQDPMLPHAEVHGKDIACIDLRTFFKITSDRPAKQELVTINTSDGVYGIAVDKILGNRQIVIKPLGKLFHNCTGVSNSTILGDGTVAIVLDVFKLTDIIISKGKVKI